MARGRATGRGRGRGAAAASQRPQTESNEADLDANQAPSRTNGSADAASASSPAPAAAGPSTTTTTPARRGATAPATRGSTAGRFRPRNIRRDEAGRDSLARQEEQKASERAADERRARGRSRFRSKRSRGDTMGSRGGFGRSVAGASGPFSSGLAQSAGPSRPGGWSGGSASGVGSASGSKQPGSSSRSSKAGFKATPGFDVAESGFPRETRINADKLHVMSPDEELDSEDEVMREALSNRATSVLPMGIYRREHKESEVVVATTAELEAAETGEEESLWVDGRDPSSLPLEAQPEEQGIWDSASARAPLIKKEPDAEEEAMDLDASSKSPLDEEAKKPVKVKKPTPQDPEDKMIQSDLNILANELGTVTVTEDGETTTSGPTNKDGRMYLFQFPPVLPPLKPGSVDRPPSKVKQEPQDVDMAEVSAVQSDPTPVDLTQEEATNGREADEEDDPEHKGGFMSDLLTDGGMVGRLNVRRSGKVELDWAGKALELSPAVDMNFQTTAVIVEQGDEKPDPGAVGGESIGMGKIMGRFVLAPTWTEEEEWVVSPEELNVG